MPVLRSLVVLLALLAFVTSCSPGENTETSSIELTAWTYRWGDSPRDTTGRLTWLDEAPDAPGWSRTTMNGRPGAEHGEDVVYLWMRTQLPPTDWRDTALQIDPVLGHYEAYLDGQRIDHIGAFDDERLLFHGYQWCMLPLAKSERPRELTLRFRGSPWLVGVRGRVVVGSRASHVREIVRHDFARMVTALLAVLVGLAALLFAAMTPSGRRLRFTFGVYAVGAGGYAAYYTKLKDILVDAPLFWEDVHRMSVQASLIGILMFTARVFGPGYRGVLRKLWKLELAVALPFYLFVYTLGYRSSIQLQAHSQAWFELGFRMIILVAVVAILAHVTQRARRGNRDAQIFLAGICPYALFVLRDLLAALGLVRFAWDSWTFLGTFGFMVSLMLIVQRHRDAEIRAYASDKARMLKDLHDGIGGITTNIGLLANIASQGPSERREKLVADIADLSREGMAELRSLLDSLDEQELTWERLTKQLRHLGSQALGPHDMSFALDSSIDPSAPAPTSFAYVHIVRTYREAVTNVIKHAGAKGVSARLDVAPDALELQVVDDGAGFQEDRSRGRGLENMRNRARELGGEIDFGNSEPGGYVALRVPLPIRTPEPGVPLHPEAG